jgi:hypothetical protein
MDLLPVGTKVRVITAEHGRDQFGLIGTIYMLYEPAQGDFVYRVRCLREDNVDKSVGFWDGSYENAYRDGDLEPVTEDGPW